jgi:hypothetical protein
MTLPLPKKFSDYKPDGHLWITLSTGEYYPDILPLACEFYKPVLVIFGQLLAQDHSFHKFIWRSHVSEILTKL